MSSAPWTAWLVWKLRQSCDVIQAPSIATRVCVLFHKCAPYFGNFDIKSNGHLKALRHLSEATNRSNLKKFWPNLKPSGIFLKVIFSTGCETKTTIAHFRCQPSFQFSFFTFFFKVARRRRSVIVKMDSVHDLGQIRRGTIVIFTSYQFQHPCEMFLCVIMAKV